MGDDGANHSEATASVHVDLSTFITTLGMDSSTTGITTNVSFQNYLNSTTATTTVKALTVEDYQDYQIAEGLNKYMSPIVIIFGLIGNILSILVMKLTSMKLTNSSLYLSALAVFDIGVLIVGLGYRWTLSMFEINIRLEHEWLCKLHMFFTYTFIDLSAWMLVCVSVDRVILVYLPLKAKSICTRMKTIIAILLVTLFIIGVNLHWIFSVGKYDYMWNGKKYSINCYYQDGFVEFHQKYWPWIDAAVASLIPFTILIICNVLIALQLLRAGRMRKKQMNVANSKQDDMMRSMTIMLVTISLVFLCLTSPVVVELIRKLARQLNADKNQERITEAERAREILVWAVVNMLMYLNSAMNFVMYCLSGRKFRDSLRELFCGKKAIIKGSTRTVSSRMSMSVSETNGTTKVNNTTGSNKPESVSGNGQFGLSTISGSHGGSKMDKVLGRTPGGVDTANRF